MKANISVTLETRLVVERVDTKKGEVTFRSMDGISSHTVREGDTIVLPLTWHGGQS